MAQVGFLNGYLKSWRSLFEFARIIVNAGNMQKTYIHTCFAFAIEIRHCKQIVVILVLRCCIIIAFPAVNSVVLSIRV